LVVHERSETPLIVKMTRESSSYSRPGEPNPYVIGREAVQNVLTVLSECAKAREVVAAAK
jgi:hypothetical protein